MSQPSLRVRLVGFLVFVAMAALGVALSSGGRAQRPAVTTAAVTRGDVVESVMTTGSVAALTSVDVGTQVSGTVKALYADFNDVVRKGQVLARLDPSLFETQVEQAGASVVRAEADLGRLRVGLDDARVKLQRATQLSTRALIPPAELEAAQVAARSAEADVRSSEAALAQARASLNLARVNLEHTIIRSPIDGIVVSRNVDVGQTVAASMSAPTLFVLAADLTRMRVNASLDESQVGKVSAGQEVTFRVDAYPDETFAGRVAQVRLQPLVSQNVVTYTTVIDVENQELKLKPGLTATVNVEVARRDGVLRLPNAALRFRPTTEVAAALGATGLPAQRPTPGESGRGTVWRLSHGTLTAVDVTTGVSDGTVTEVLGGPLDAGEELITGVTLDGVAGAAKASTPKAPTNGNPLMSGPQGPPPRM